METLPNNSAFPEIVSEQDGNRILAEVYSTGGLSIRAYMATKAMQGLLANEHWCGHGGEVEDIPNLSVKMADALISQLNKK